MRYLFIFCLLILSCDSKKPSEKTKALDSASVDKPIIKRDPSISLWQTYISDRYNFTIDYPNSWKTHSQTDPFTLINIASDKSQPPLYINEDASKTFISFMPEGYGTELPSGKKLAFSEYKGGLPIEFEIAPQSSYVFLLENETPWAYFLTFHSPPEGWSEHGFIFIQMEVDDANYTCIDGATGEKKPMENCDPLGQDEVKIFGSVSSKYKDIVWDMLRTLHFTMPGKERRKLSDLIKIDSPDSNATISSPLKIKGQARGYWYFEASFSIEIVDANYNKLGGGIATADGEWMTEDFVPFTAEVSFSKPQEPNGFIIFKRSNASGKPEMDRSLTIPVHF